jgi:chemotaxis protein CheZ
MNRMLSAPALEQASNSHMRSRHMPIQRKVFRVEQMGSIDASAASASTAATDREPFKIEADGLRQLQHEAEAIHNAIARTKQEIAMLHAGAFGHGRPRAARELHAVVDGTERAAHQIMDAAETIAKAAKALTASGDRGQNDELSQQIRDHVLRIFEACNFQDLSGQRITKVLAMLQFIDESIARMMEIWGGAEAFKHYGEASRNEPSLVNGPKLTGESGHVSQADIDAILEAG